MPSVDLKISIPLQIAEDFLAKLYYVSENLASFEFEKGRLDRVSFRLKAGNDSESAVISQRMVEIAGKMCRAYRPSEPKVLASRMRPAQFDQDPYPILEKSGQLFRYGQGRFGLGPLPVKLIACFETAFLKMAQKVKAEEHQFPTLIGADVLERCRYIQSFPHALSVISHLREDLASIQDFAKHAKWDGKSLAVDSKNLAGVQCLLPPTVCFHCYAWLQNSVQKKPRAFTAVGKCFRYESGNLGGLERLWDFTMREIIFVGPQDYVLEKRQLLIDETIALLDRWEMAYEIKTATDPFFIEDYSTQTAFQSAFDLKFELRTALPYKKSTLAAGSFNYHQDFFGRILSIHNESGQPLHTSCFGYGFERLALAFLAQYGLEPAKWPKVMRQEFEFPG